METLNVLYNIEEKQETRPLYEEVFPEDKGEFLDYYYEDRCRDNVIIDIKRENAVIAMAHFNPFTMETRDGRTFPVMYIYAVSTKKAERHKGYMRRILIEGFRIMTEKGISFCYLIPQRKKSEIRRKSGEAMTCFSMRMPIIKGGWLSKKK